MTTLNTFTVLTNAIDTDLKIIRHDETGFYNATKAALMIARKTGTSPKRVNDFDRLDTTKILVAALKEKYEIEDVERKFNDNTNKDFHGTYMHEHLYQSFLIWLDAGYAIKVFDTIKDIQETANRRALQEKDDTINEIRTMMAEQRARAIESDKKLDSLIKFSNKTMGQNKKLHLKMDMNHKELSESLDYLVDKSFHSTIDPDDDGKVTHFAVLAPNTKKHVGKTMIVRGQIKHITKVIKKVEETHTPVIDTTYNANAINLMVNAKERYLTMVNKYVTAYNKPINEYNLKLKEEITKHNSLINKMKRMKEKTTLVVRKYTSEKKPLLYLKDIPIIFNSTSIRYTANKHISYDSVIQIIIGMNKDTQKSPKGKNDKSVEVSSDSSDDSSSDEEDDVESDIESDDESSDDDE